MIFLILHPVSIYQVLRGCSCPPVLPFSATGRTSGCQHLHYLPMVRPVEGLVMASPLSVLHLHAVA